MSMFSGFIEWFDSTHLQEQITEVDFVGLFTNPWFMVPFVALVVYLLYKQSFKDLILLAMLIGVWWVSGTEYMNTLIIGNELQMDKVLPVVFGGAIALGLAIYILFGRSD